MLNLKLQQQAGLAPPSAPRAPSGVPSPAPTAHVPPAHQGAGHLPGPTQPVLAPCEYKTGKTLGQGSYATVKEAVHVKTGKRYAVKVISKQLMKGKEVMILNEIEVLKRISKGHPNIVTLWDYFETPNNLYLVMDLCVGGELFDRICEKGSYYEEDAAAIVRVVVDAIRYLHEQNIVHRDIKAENLLFRTRESSDPKDLLIADFGLSKIIDDNQYHLLMTTCGTPGYMAPEVIRRVGHHKPVDMWSVGVLTYFLLCGYTPFDAASQAEEIQNILKGKYAFEPKEYWEDVSEEAKDFVRRLLVINPKDRLTAAEALKHPFINPQQMHPETPVAMTPVGSFFPAGMPFGAALPAGGAADGAAPIPAVPIAIQQTAPLAIPIVPAVVPLAGPPSAIATGTPGGVPIPIPAGPVPISHFAASAPPDAILRQMAALQGQAAGGSAVPVPTAAVPIAGAVSYMDQSALAQFYGGSTPGSAALFGTSLPMSRERVNLLPTVRKNITAKQRLRRAVNVVEAANAMASRSHGLTGSKSSSAGSLAPAAAATASQHGRNGSNGDGEGSSPMLVATRKTVEVPSLSGLSIAPNAGNR